MFQTAVVETNRTHILCSVTFFSKSCRLWDNVEKYCRVGQATDYNMAHAHCMLDTCCYKYIQPGCVTLIAFPQQHWLHKCTSVSCCMYIACLVIIDQIKVSGRDEKCFQNVTHKT